MEQRKHENRQHGILQSGYQRCFLNPQDESTYQWWISSCGGLDGNVLSTLAGIAPNQGIVG